MISPWRKDQQWTPGTPVLWCGEPWPVRNPLRFNVRAGDIFAGNIVLHADCGRCRRRCVPVDPAAIARAFEPLAWLRDFDGKFKCRSCGQTSLVHLYFPRAPNLNHCRPSLPRAGGAQG
jgi:hypothetical protein